jgi:soluble lytic murein transglycosylase-like protein
VARLQLLILLLSRNAAALTEEARDALRIGNCGEALARQEADETGIELLAVARCQIEVGKFDEAKESLALVKEPELAGYAQTLRWELWSAVADWTQLATAPLPAGLSGPALDRVHFLRGRSLVETGKAAAGKAELARLLDGPLGKPGALPVRGGADPAEVRLWLALASSGSTAERSILEALWSANPTSAYSANAEARLVDLGRPPRANEALVRARIATLEKLQEFAQALALRDELGDSEPRTMATATFQARAYDRAAAYYAQISSLGAYDTFQYALATSRAGDYAAAAERYAALVAAHPSDKWAEFASFKIGYLRFDAGELEPAITAFRTHLARYPSGEHAAEARWFVAWSLHELKRQEESLRALGELETKHPRHERAASARYWRARSDDAAVKAIATATPTSPYAYFAARRTGTTWPARRPAAFTPQDLGTRFHVGLELARVGLTDWARAALSGIATPPDRRGALTLAGALVLAGDYPRAQAMARQYCPSPAASDVLACYAAYPRPAGDTIDRLIAGSALPRHLPYAIMAAESAYKPWVTSQAGARGLMQLMPAVASKLHPSVAGSTPFDADQLYEPDYNAVLGTKELLRLWKYFSDRPEDVRLVATIAAYNGGQEAVERWLALAPKDVAGDVFAENVGYVETRAYVRRVLQHVQTYRVVYGD